ncbi:hypothetical protein E1265_18320 [Streptomyces sp. 8K308]|nr:hypothetical protein E1265_18320 [Streptomyces sp. 8K308]
MVLELAAGDPLAPGAYNETFTRFHGLAGTYRVRQVADIPARPHDLPARPDAPVVNSGVRNVLVDDYAAATFDAASGVTVDYRFFTPDVRPGRRYPLVVALHGHGESGDDNFAQIAGNQISVAFADPARQARHPAFVLSPQAPRGTPGTGGWWRSDIRAEVLELVRATLARNPAIDPSRVYLTGLSMGSYGSWALLPEHHDLFAAAVLVCGAGDETAAVDALGTFPIWSLHSADDAVVPYDAPGSDYRYSGRWRPPAIRRPGASGPAQRRTRSRRPLPPRPGNARRRRAADTSSPPSPPAPPRCSATPPGSPPTPTTPSSTGCPDRDLDADSATGRPARRIRPSASHGGGREHGEYRERGGRAEYRPGRDLGVRLVLGQQLSPLGCGRLLSKP